MFGAAWDGVAAVLYDGRSSGGRSGAAAMPSAAEVLLDAGDELPTKALLKHIEKAMGRKEASKARRNRAEALA